ncbi:MAG: hypothetical protein JWP29_5683 [Rhodoferax sp.]|nr:hypothetical protein [Rhodoferax sp.]
MSKLAIQEQAIRCSASLLGNELVRVAQINSSDPRVIIMALGAAMGRVLGQIEGKDADVLLRGACTEMALSIQQEEMNLRLRRAGILAVHEGGHA